MKVIGFFAHQGMRAACIDGDSCLIVGSIERMEEYLKEQGADKNKFSIKKTRYGEIKRGIELGAAYSFDEEAYSRFYPIGKAEGLDLKEWDKNEANKGKKYVTIRIK